MQTIMTEIIRYKPKAYCQIRFPNGDRVLVSCAQTGIKIFKLGFFGLFPTKTIADWPISRVESAIAIFADPTNPMAHPLDAIKDKLVKACSSTSDVQKLCSTGAI